MANVFFNLHTIKQLNISCHRLRDNFGKGLPAVSKIVKSAFEMFVDCRLNQLSQQKIGRSTK